MLPGTVASPSSPRHEEWWNTLTHGVGLLLSLAGLVFLLAVTVSQGDSYRVAGCAIYGTCLVALYAGSTIYHAVHHDHWKRRLQVVDHVCIYLLIAGTYTPFLLTLMRGPWGWSLLALVWGLAAIGIAAKVGLGCQWEFLSTFGYVALGWIALVAVKPILATVPVGGMVLLAAGGITYTVGVIFYVYDSTPFFHAVWHLFVMAGSVCHFVAVVLYVATMAA